MSVNLEKWQKPYVVIPFINFFIAACCGLTLRYAFVREIPWLRYKNLMHAHSHVAMLGWAFMILAFFVWRVFGQGISIRVYNNLFWTWEFSIIGMLVSFPIQGYGLYSIAFSTVFLFSALYFLFLVYRQLLEKKQAEIILLRTAIVWFFISTFGVWAMGPIVASSGSTSVYYYMAIQFFLHFQFNGWFTFVVLALFFRQLNALGISFSLRNFRRFYFFLSISCILTFALAVTWADPEGILFLGNSLGVFIQLVALFFFLRTLNLPVRRALRQKMQPFVFRFYQISFFSFLAKIIIQSLVIIPSVAVISYTIRLYVLGFIHLILLGSITIFVLGFGFSTGAVRYDRRIATIGWLLVLLGFILTEALLFGQGTMLWAGIGYLDHYYLLIFLFSVLLPLGILLGLLGNLGENKSIPLKQPIYV